SIRRAPARRAPRGFRRRLEIALLAIKFEPHRRPGFVVTPARSRQVMARKRAASGALAWRVRAEMALEVAHHRPDFRDRGAKPVLAYAEFVRPVSGFVFLVHVNAKAVLPTSQRAIVGHPKSPFGNVVPTILGRGSGMGNAPGAEIAVGAVRHAGSQGADSLSARIAPVPLTPRAAALPSRRSARAVPGCGPASS